MTVKLRVDWSRMVYLPTGRFGFDSDPGLHDLKLLSCTWAFPLCILVLYGELINMPSLSNKPPVSIKPPPPPPSHGLELNKPLAGLNRGFVVCLYGGRGGGGELSTQTCLDELYLRTFSTNHFQTWFYWFQGALSSGVNRFSLTDPCLKLALPTLTVWPWNSLFGQSTHGVTI